MDIDLLVVPECPHTADAQALLRRALDDVGLGHASFSTTDVTSLSAAQELGFPGSPTFLLDGIDPFAGPELQVALACRLYATERGLTGLPDLPRLRQAIKQAAQISREGAESRA